MAKRNRKKPGLPPGSIVYTGQRKVEHISIHYLEYNQHHFSEKLLDNRSFTACPEAQPHQLQWFDLRGLHDTQLIETIGKTFDVHPLVLEDIVNTQQRPKFEEYDKGLFLVVQALHWNAENGAVLTEQVAIYFGRDFLLSFQEDEADLFPRVRERIQSGKGRIRQRKADYLAYALLDTIVDNYFLVLDEIEVRIEQIEDEIMNRANEKSKSRIHYLKQEMLTVRKAISPLREAIARFAKCGHTLVEDDSELFLRDLHDHTVQIMDIAETYRDALNGLQDLYLSEITLRMNNIMQVLTIITTIFVPITFLAGVYGMNFDHMPELHWRYGYFILWGIMISIAVGLIVWFKRKGWM